jgi:hypothetical protein
MPERGVSRRVTVKFDEVGVDGRLNEAASRRAETADQVELPEAAEDAAAPDDDGTTTTVESGGLVIETEPIDPSTLRAARTSPTANLAEVWADGDDAG